MISLDPNVEKLIWLAFFGSFAVKVPMLPVHIWLPEAHVEAPTAGSVFLAGILLKLGTYGLIRLSIPMFPYGNTFFAPFVVTLCLLAIVYASLTAIRQTDIKRIIAYASVAHMNMTLLGIFSMSVVGIAGGVFQMLAHGVVAGALFLCVGVLYDRYHSRLTSYYGGVATFMPLYALMFLAFTMANIALPGTANFTGEFLIMLGLMSWTTVGTLFSASGLVLGGAYSLWLLNRVIYGNIKSGLSYTPDLSHVEMATLFPLFIIMIWMGLYPHPFLSTREVSSAMIAL
jgi:NADH-quinone oxidoreductase subunit M